MAIQSKDSILGSGAIAIGVGNSKTRRGGDLNIQAGKSGRNAGSIYVLGGG